MKLVDIIRAARDDRADEAHECFNTGDEDAMIAELRVTNALTHALDVLLAEGMEDYEPQPR